MEKLRRNLGYKILSVVAAILLYYIAYNQQNPQATRDITLHPKLVNLPEDMIVKGEPKGVVVTITGSAPLVDALHSRMIPATVDLSEAHEGINRLPIEYELPTGARRRLMDGDDSLVSEVVLEKKERQKFVVDVLHDETALAGYHYAEALTTPREATVSGRSDEVRRVARVIADVQNRSDRGTIDQTVVLTAQDSQRKTLRNVTVTPEKVRVQIALERTLGRKRLLLSLNRIGNPAPGYQLYDYTFSPAVLTVRGAEDALLSRSYLDVQVDVEGIAASETRTVKVVPPTGLTIDGAETVRVRLEVRRISPQQIIKPDTPATNPPDTNRPTTAPQTTEAPRNNKGN